MRIELALIVFGLVIARMALVKPMERLNVDVPEVRLREAIESRLIRWLPGDTGALAAGLLIGGDDLLSYRIVEDFRSAGLSHITAASGYNVVVVSGWLMGGLVRLVGRKRAIYFGIVSILIYTVIAGLTIPVIRAGLMVIFGYIGLLLGRKADSWWNLFVITSLMVIFKPHWAFDISFQLSVAATVGVILGGRMTYFGSKTTWIKGLISDAKTTMGAWIFTLPIIMHYFGRLSIVAPLANLAVTWVIPPVMEVLGLAVAVGAVWDSGGAIIAILSWPGLKWLLEGAGWFSKWPGADVEIGRMGWSWVIIYYIVIGLISYKLKIKRNN